MLAPPAWGGAQPLGWSVLRWTGLQLLLLQLSVLLLLLACRPWLVCVAAVEYGFRSIYVAAWVCLDVNSIGV